MKASAGISGMGRDGFTYMGLLIAVMVMGITAMVVVQSWKSVARIEKERQLIWVGHQFRNAIRGYNEYRKTVLKMPGDHYPTDLKDLVSDPGRAGGYSWLRKIYDDPMTGKSDWILVQSGNGIKGVRSNSMEEPLKKAGFDVDDSSFTLKTRYTDWVFEVPPVIFYAGPPVPGYLQAIGTGGAPGAGAGGWGPGGWPSQQPGGTTGWPGQQPPPPPPKDSDGDGVYDDMDECPSTPSGVPVDSFGCPFDVDSDGDGVSDADDDCPGTPRGVEVDSDGCPPE